MLAIVRLPGPRDTVCMSYRMCDEALVQDGRVGWGSDDQRRADADGQKARRALPAGARRAAADAALPDRPLGGRRRRPGLRRHPSGVAGLRF